MAIPPFPSQDLAKLVLGYLAEEQLMTAYDEFLQASPYLDAMRNEYDRIFMTSLKSILAEYRAVKIYVETCKPFLLRKKLFQCPNLLEIVRFLVNHIDANKLPMHEFGDNISTEKFQTTNIFKLPGCEVCNSLKLSSCVCKTKQNHQKIANSLPVIHQDQTSLVNSVETTSLADLPGSHIKNKKQHIIVLDKGCTFMQSYSNTLSEQSSRQPSGIISNDGQHNLCSPMIENSQKPFHINLGLDTTLKGSHLTESKQKIDEFNNVLSTVCKKNTVRDNREINVKNSNKKGSTTGSFQDFASGVRDGENLNAITPDSSTSDNLNVQSCTNNKKCGNVIGTPRPQLFLKVETLRSNVTTQDNDIINTANNYPYAKIRPADQKVKILSDVKVDNAYKSNDKKKIPSINNATSTPLMKMQTIVINGTPAYRTQPIQAHQQIFSKDEIMAMPTIIVVPSSGGHQMPIITQVQPAPSQNTSTPSIQPVTSQSTSTSSIQPVTSQSTSTTTIQPVTSQSTNTTIESVFSQSISTTTATQSCTINKLLSPLIIDISPTLANVTNNETNLTKGTIKEANEVGLVKTVDVVKHLKNTSVPKDIVTSLAESTPPIVTLTKKSSSTPRRTSHIRVLDFTTPRRILHETINENISDENNGSPSEVVITENCVRESSSVINDIMDENNIKNEDARNGNIVSTVHEDITEKVVLTGKASWDTKLRAMVATSNDKFKSKTRIKISKKKDSNDTDDTGEKESRKIRKSKKAKKKQVIDDDEPENIEKSEVPAIKPTINIKPGFDWVTTSAGVDKKESEDNQNKLMDDERVDTPEIDRITLQNVIGAKLNISELLETPYKQVLYDIQMETPKCLGPDLPGEPMSDIKIMNIPTPRFFDSPEIIPTTPPYSSSRPTDYSSGGSYYKPDDQDYIPASDFKCVITSSKVNTKVEQVKENSSHNKKNSRPVRKCAKNVSYYNSSKIKDSEDKTDAVSSCSESVTSNSLDSKGEKEILTVLQDKPTEVSKSDGKKKSSRKRKSPVTKEKPKAFMKIKPRRLTPIKESLATRIRKKTMQGTSPKLQRKRTTSKEKNIHVTPAVTCVPTKSRRKSSTPRKLHCNKTFNSESSGHDSSEVNEKRNMTRDTNSMSTQDSDVDQLALRWSDDGSQDVKIVEGQTNVANDSEDISKIQEYIETTIFSNPLNENEGVFQNDLVKRGFDIETARIIERDLLDTPPQSDSNRTVLDKTLEPGVRLSNNTLENTLETVSNNTNELQGRQSEEDENDEIQLSVHECNEETNNFIVFEFNDTKETSARPPITLKDKFSMEVCIDDDETIRLRATPFSILYECNQNDEKRYNTKETEEAVNSILSIDKLYTPLKTSINAQQVYDIFDSTLTSLDTPLKVNSPKKLEHEITISAIVLEEEETASNGKVDVQKRKRQQSDGADDSSKESKKAKSDAQYLLSSANIQNIDIETVLKKLHGP